jgi:integrase
LAIHFEQLKNQAGITQGTRQRYEETTRYIIKTWDGFENLSLADVNKESVRRWKDSVLNHGTGYLVPGAKAISKKCNGSSVGYFRKAVTTLRRIMDLAVIHHALSSNPIRIKLFARNELKDVPHKPKLPEGPKLLALFDRIEAKGKRFGWFLEIADFCRFLMFTGARLEEANGVTWRDVNFERGELTLNGTKSDAARRTVPLLPDAKRLLEKIKARREQSALTATNGVPDLPAGSKVLGVSEATKSLTAACREMEIERLTHHDLRDAFATQALEAKVPIPTVAAWLGHADGGALLLKVYAHHRSVHGSSEAAKVDFSK